MKVILVVFSLLLCLSVQAGCYDNLINGGINKDLVNDSAVYRVNPIKGNTFKSKSKKVILSILSKAGCKPKKIRVLCGIAVKDIFETEICYSAIKVGYFIVSSDYLENLTIIFNRWD